MKKIAKLLFALTLAGVLSACGGGGKGTNGSSGSNQSPTQVMLVAASSINEGSISASWLTASDDSTAPSGITYQLHAALDPAFTPSASTKVFEGRGVTTGSAGKLTPGQSYTVRLVAVDDQGASTTSEAITVAVSASTATLQPGVKAQVLPVSQVANVTDTSFDLPAIVTVPAVGSVVASTDANGGQGFLRKVTATSTTGGLTTVQTAPASLDEVFSNLELSSNVTLGAVPATVAAASLDGGRARILAYSAKGESSYQAYRWDNGLQYRAAVGQRRPLAAVAETVSKAFTGTAGFTVTDAVDVHIDPKVEFNAKVGLLTQPYARIVVHTAPRIDQHLTVDATGAGTLDATQDLIAPRQFRQVLETPVGIPIVISGTFQVSMHIEGSVSGALHASEQFTLGFTDLTAGFEYRNGEFTPITGIVPEYSLRYGGNGKATANLKISLVPSLTLTGYEVLTGKVVLQPYLGGTAGIEGQVQIGAAVNFDSLQAGLPLDADFRLTAAQLSTGTNAWVYGDLHFLSKTIFKYPSGADPEDYTTLKQFELLPETVLADLPILELALPNGVGTGKGIVVTATATDTPNPLKARFTSLPSSFIPWQAWTAPRLIPPVGVTTGYTVTGSNGNYVVNLTEPGKYTLRVGGYSNWGSWARQYTEIELDYSGGFTKISADGKDLPADATTWACVRHNATGLLWEAHVTRQTPPRQCDWHAAPVTCTGYTNFGDGRAYDASTVPATVGSLCGKTGWRLPTEAEGRALVAEQGYVATNSFGSYQTWFGADDTAILGWTSSPVAGGNDVAWFVNFYGGYVGFSSLGDYDTSVRLVAGP